MKLLEELSLKQHALELQTKLLEDAYGDYLSVTIEGMKWPDAFSGTNMKIGPSTQDIDVIVLRVNDEFDNLRLDPYGEEGVKIILTPDGKMFTQPFNDDPKALLHLPNDIALIRSTLKRFRIKATVGATFVEADANGAIKNGLSLLCDDNVVYHIGERVISRDLKVDQELFLYRKGGPSQVCRFKHIQPELSRRKYESLEAAFKGESCENLRELAKANVNMWLEEYKTYGPPGLFRLKLSTGAVPVWRQGTKADHVSFYSLQKARQKHG